MGPLGGWAIKKFDEKFQSKIPTGFEMLVNNFSAGLIGFGLVILAFFAIGPVVATLTGLVGSGVQPIVDAKLLPIANIIIEPAKVLFLNNALNHGIFTPLGTEQAASTGKSILYLLEANPGPGLGILLAYDIFGKGSAKASSWGATIIHFLGGIHEIYFPYVMMKPAMFLAAVAGGVTGTFTFQLLGAGLSSPASPGSIIAIMLMAPKGLAPHLVVLTGVLAVATVSFLVAAMILKIDKSTGDDLAEAQAATAAKAQARGQASTTSASITEDISVSSIDQIIFACDAGMGASILRDKVKKAGLTIPVTNKAIANLTDVDRTLIVTQEELAPRAYQRTPRAAHVSVDNFLATPKYDEIVSLLTEKPKVSEPLTSTDKEYNDQLIDVNHIDKVIFTYDKAEGSATMGQSTLAAIFKAHEVMIPIEKVPLEELDSCNQETNLVVTTIANQTSVHGIAPKAQSLVVDSFVTTPEYDKLVERITSR